MNQSSSIERMYEQHPLLKFSLYTQLQVDTVRNLGIEIERVLDEGLSVPGIVEPIVIREAYPKFWLWILGAFEICRTMNQSANRCLSQDLARRLKDYKKVIGPARSAFAKLKRSSSNIPIEGDLSVREVAFDSRDLLFRIDDLDYSMRALIDEFESISSSLSLSDIRADHRAVGL